MAALFVPPRYSPIDGNGLAMPGSKLYFYVTGTSTPLDTYTDSGLATPNLNPVPADANGLFPPIYLLSQTLYKVIFKTSADVTVWTTDPVEGAPLDTTPAVGLLRSYLAGLNTSRFSTTRIDVAAGACADDTNAVALLMSAGSIDCTTVGANGLDGGALANTTWYHSYAIAKTDGTKALLASTSATTPTLPSGYVYKRRLGSFKTNGSAQILDYVQDGDLFMWKAPVTNDVNATNPGTSAVTRTLGGVPTGVNVLAIIQGVPINTGTGGLAQAYFSDLATDDTAAGSGVSDTAAASTSAAGAQTAGSRLQVRTNTSAQIRSRLSFSDANVTLVINTLGWVDRRGRDS